MKNRRWTAEERHVVAANYHLGVEHCVSLLPGRSKAAVRSCAKSLGIAPPKQLWRKPEDEAISRLYPDYDALAKLLTHRTRKAIIARAMALGVQRKLRKWTGAAVRRLVIQASHMSMQEIYAANPGRCPTDIRHYLNEAGATPPRARIESGIELLDRLRDRCLAHAIPFRHLGRRVGNTNALSLCCHSGHKSLEAQWTEPAVHALGGELYVEWED